jgi:hypothetical protein
MKLIVWNSQGNKWDLFWNQYVNPAITNNPNEIVLGLLVEAGWPPWQPNQDVRCGHPYHNQTRYGNSDNSFWIPWVKTFSDDHTNSRCSIGGILKQYDYRVEYIASNLGPTRPFVRLELGLGKYGGRSLTVFLVHLTSGATRNTWKELALFDQISQYLPVGSTGAMIVGDINVNLQTGPPTLKDDRWRIVNTNQQTLASGGELDYGFEYRTKKNFSAQVQILQQYKTPNGNPSNPSDHSILQYQLAIF